MSEPNKNAMASTSKNTEPSGGTPETSDQLREKFLDEEMKKQKLIC